MVWRCAAGAAADEWVQRQGQQAEQIRRRMEHNSCLYHSAQTACRATCICCSTAAPLPPRAAPCSHLAHGGPVLLLRVRDVLAQHVLRDGAVRLLLLLLAGVLLLLLLGCLWVAAGVASHHKLSQALILHWVHDVAHHTQHVKPARAAKQNSQQEAWL